MVKQKQLETIRPTGDGSAVYETWPVTRPKPNPHNARVHSAEQVSLLADSIRTFGILRALVVDEPDTLLAGHGLLVAAQKAGYAQVPVAIHANLTDQQKRAYLIADNGE